MRRRLEARAPERLRGRAQLVGRGPRQPRRRRPPARSRPARRAAARAPTGSRRRPASAAAIDARAASTLALRKPQQGHARLRIAAEVVGACVRLLGTGEVAATAADLADLVVAVGDDEDVDAGHLAARLQRFVLGAAPTRPACAAARRDARDRCRGTAMRPAAASTTSPSPTSTPSHAAGRRARGTRRADRSRSRRSTSASAGRTARRPSPRRATPGLRPRAPA